MSMIERNGRKLPVFFRILRLAFYTVAFLGCALIVIGIPVVLIYGFKVAFF